MKQIEWGVGASSPRQTEREDIIDTHQGRESARVRASERGALTICGQHGRRFTPH